MNFYKIMFMLIMVMGVTISLSSNNWISIWVGMEMSMMSFVPLMSSEKMYSSESCMKYFIIQSLSSSLMLMGIIMNSYNMNFKIMIMMALIMKLGMVPFHLWIISIIEGINYLCMFMLFTLMKIVPLNITSFINSNNQMISILGMIFSTLSAIIQNSTKKILTYSSIYNMSVMMTSINEFKIWFQYMMIYSLTTLIIIYMMMKKKISFINQISMNNFKIMDKTFMLIMMLSIGGLPPMPMFISKMIISENLIMKKELIVMSFLIMTSLISMFFYMRLSMISMMNFSLITKWMMFLSEPSSSKISMLIMLSFTLLSYIKSLM